MMCLIAAGHLGSPQKAATPPAGDSPALRALRWRVVDLTERISMSKFSEKHVALAALQQVRLCMPEIDIVISSIALAKVFRTVLEQNTETIDPSQLLALLQNAAMDVDTATLAATALARCLQVWLSSVAYRP